MAFSHMHRDSSSQTEENVETFQMMLHGGERVKLRQPVYKFHRRDGQDVFSVAPKFYEFVYLEENQIDEMGADRLISNAIYKIVSVKYPYEKLSYTLNNGLKTENTLKQFSKQFWKLESVEDGHWTILSKLVANHRNGHY